MMRSFRVDNRIFPLTLLVFWKMASYCTALGNKGLHFDYMGSGSKVLRLSCDVNTKRPGEKVMAIILFNATSNINIAVVKVNEHPTLAKQHQAANNLFLAGGVNIPHHSKHPSLQVVYLHYESFAEQTFGCTIKIMTDEAEMVFLTWNVTVSPKEVSTTTTTTSSPYRIGAVKNDEGGSKPISKRQDGLPMMVLIVMLVIISILLFLAVFMLMYRYRSRCQRRDEDMYRPPAYCLAPDHPHHLDWSDHSSSLKSAKGSARTLNPRGHYSLAAHQNMPLPPIPHMTPSRRNKTYRRPPSVNSSVRVQYIQPQDAIGQESSEDGEIAALSSGSPNVHYKTSRDRHNRMNSPLYACVPVSSTDE